MTRTTTQLTRESSIAEAITVTAPMTRSCLKRLALHPELHRLSDISLLTALDIAGMNGIGPAKAAALVSFLESLGVRLASVRTSDGWRVIAGYPIHDEVVPRVTLAQAAALLVDYRGGKRFLRTMSKQDRATFDDADTVSLMVSLSHLGLVDIASLQRSSPASVRWSMPTKAYHFLRFLARQFQLDNEWARL